MNHLQCPVALVLCALSTFGCNDSATTSHSNDETIMRKQQAFDIVGTWHSPPRDQKPIQGEWGPTRITKTFTKTGQVESIVKFMDAEENNEIKLVGKYSIKKGNVLLEQFIGDDGTIDDPIRSTLSLRNKLLVMDMDDEVYIFEKIN